MNANKGIRIYIDATSIETLGISMSDIQEKPASEVSDKVLRCSNFLRHHADLRICALDSQTEKWLKYIYNGSGNPRITNQELPKRVTDLEDFSAIYLISKQEAKEHKIDSTNFVVSGGTGDKEMHKELDTIDKIFIGENQSDKQYHLILNPKEIFNTIDSSERKLETFWQVMVDKWQMPMSDVIVFDRYLLDNDINNNTIPLLQQLIGNIKKKDRNAKLNIILICYMPNKGNLDENISFIKNTNNKIKGGKNAIQVTTIVLNRNEIHSTDNNIDEHDRTIFFNYGMIQSGDSYSHYLQENEKKESIEFVSGGRSWHIMSFGDHNNYSYGIDFIERMQGILDLRHKKDFTYDKNIHIISTDAKSNFLKFDVTNNQ